MITFRFSKSIQEKLKNNLINATQTGNIQSYRISLSFIWYSEGKSMSDIATDLKITVRTVFGWLKTFRHRGMDWVNGKHYHGRGRKSKLTKTQKQELYDMIVAGPQANGYGIWNTAMIGELIIRKFKVSYNCNYLSILLNKMGLSFQKARFISDKENEEQYEQARKKWMAETWPEIVKKAAKENAVILFGDEVSFAMWGSLARTWAPIGQQPVVQTTGIRKGLKMFGVIEVKGGDFQYMESLAYSLKAKSLKLLKQEGLPADLLLALKTLKNEQYRTKPLFIAGLKTVLDEKLIIKYQEIILKHTETSGRFNGDSYIEFLKQILEHYKGNVILIEDGASYHKRGDVMEFKEKSSRLSVFSLPTFSPDLNPIEKLWKNTKRDATHLKYFKTFEELRLSVIETFKSYMNNAKKIICVMQKLRENLIYTAVSC